MVYYPNQQDRRQLVRVKHPFSFHHHDEVLEGRDVSEIGLSVYCPYNREDGKFYFNNGQKLKDCFIQIEGQTFYYTRLRVVRLEQEGQDVLYGIEIDHMLEPEQQRFEAFYTHLKNQSTEH